MQQAAHAHVCHRHANACVTVWHSPPLSHIAYNSKEHPVPDENPSSGTEDGFWSKLAHAFATTPTSEAGAECLEVVKAWAEKLPPI